MTDDMLLVSNIRVIGRLADLFAVVTILLQFVYIGYYWIKTGSLREALRIYGKDIWGL